MQLDFAVFVLCSFSIDFRFKCLDLLLQARFEFLNLLLFVKQLLFSSLQLNLSLSLGLLNLRVLVVDIVHHALQIVDPKLQLLIASEF